MPGPFQLIDKNDHCHPLFNLLFLRKRQQLSIEQQFVFCPQICHIQILVFTEYNKYRMNIRQLLPKKQRPPEKQLTQLDHLIQSHLPFTQRRGLSEPRTKFNLVKINKHKLPLDFFLQKQALLLKEQSKQIILPLQFTEPPRLETKNDSEWKHYSPEKSSFFGSHPPQESKLTLRINTGCRFLSRKFQTRDESKRDSYALELTRKTNTAARSHKNQLLELNFNNYDSQLQELLTASSKTQNCRSPTKYDTSYKLSIANDPQSWTERQSSWQLSGGRRMLKGSSERVQECMAKINNKKESMSEKGECLNITFYNAKSGFLPPLMRSNSKQL